MFPNPLRNLGIECAFILVFLCKYCSTCPGLHRGLRNNHWPICCSLFGHICPQSFLVEFSIVHFALVDSVVCKTSVWRAHAVLNHLRHHFFISGIKLSAKASTLTRSNVKFPATQTITKSRGIIASSLPMSASDSW